MDKTLIYVHDPMCSWCFAFEPLRRELAEAIGERLPVRRLLGGLAPDTDEPMPASTRDMIARTWRRIEQVVPGARFNHDFWSLNQPRRSTYPSNRAVIAARQQDPAADAAMTSRIQQAYYREARNPSDDVTLIELAADLGLDRERFARDLNSQQVRDEHLGEIRAARALGINGFPSLAVSSGGEVRHLALSYTDLDFMLEQVGEATGSLP